MSASMEFHQQVTSYVFQYWVLKTGQVTLERRPGSGPWSRFTSQCFRSLKTHWCPCQVQKCRFNWCVVFMAPQVIVTIATVRAMAPQFFHTFLHLQDPADSYPCTPPSNPPTVRMRSSLRSASNGFWHLGCRKSFIPRAFQWEHFRSSQWPGRDFSSWPQTPGADDQSWVGPGCKYPGTFCPGRVG